MSGLAFSMNTVVGQRSFIEQIMNAAVAYPFDTTVMEIRPFQLVTLSTIPNLIVERGKGLARVCSSCT
ncbi:hypothetical protein PsorP6_008015 [Peronosclerospora sorghi]|uniref:Uncharacterized protein n=1 Tax=Peronosclerospora sorghi TaxID=230839 RepID=A0ACC0W7S8_9STRA|nr:hypothetical protein PsorP6_008015 [Peronosclerospora sorghi]